MRTDGCWVKHTTFDGITVVMITEMFILISGDISYNGYKLEEFVPQRTAAYISQNDLHIPEMTVRETLDFSSRCQGTGSRADIMMEVNRREKEGGIIPDPDIDTFMKVTCLLFTVFFDK
ncbi:hypothetical protein Hanom_Chr00s002522g01701091 [Helianthus anomalus]